MKKFLALLLVVLLVLSTFAACNSGNSTETEKPTDEQTEKDTEKETEKQTEKETEKQTENSGDNSGNNNAGDNNTGDNTGDNDNTGDDDTKPEEPKAYFFGMVQANVDAEKVFYLTGEMSGYYMATTDKSAEALEVFLEATEGGYYLYCVIDEVKTYINMVVSGAYVNGAYEATASTVYTLDETLNTLKANVTVEADETKSGEYWFGTRNDKTFTTVGPVLVAYEGFFCKLYDAANTEDAPVQKPEDDNTGDDNTGDDNTGDTPACEHTDANTDFLCDNECGTIMAPAADSVLSIEDAIKLGSLFEKGTNGTYTDGKYYVTGVIVSITSPTQYGNITITDGTNEFLVYGTYSADGSTQFGQMADKPVVGDTVTIYGIIGMYNAAQMKNGNIVNVVAHEHNYEEGSCTICGVADPDYVAPCEHDFVDGACTKCGEADPNYVPTCEHDFVDGTCTKCGEADPDYVAPCEHDFVDGTCTKCGEADPDYVAPCEHDFVDGACTKCGEADPNYVAITPIADAIAAADGTEVTVRGIVVEIVSGWNEQYNNISVNIIDDAGNVLYLYRTGVNCVVGDLVTVTGKMDTFGGSRQLAQGSTGEVSVATDAYKVAYEYYQISTMQTYFKEDAERYFITEPTKYAATIVWTNADGETVTEFNIPQTDALQEVVFTLTITVGNATFTKDITITVEAKPQTGLETLATFDLGANGSASHSDGSAISTTLFTDSGYELNIEGATNVYSGARDAMGNSCLKLGTSKAAGSFSFTVADDVKQVVIKIAKYKTNVTKISVNGGETQTLTKNSADGEYDVITVDTTTNKTVTIATVSGGVRAMIDSITYMG